MDSKCSVCLLLMDWVKREIACKYSLWTWRWSIVQLGFAQDYSILCIECLFLPGFLCFCSFTLFLWAHLPPLIIIIIIFTFSLSLPHQLIFFLPFNIFLIASENFPLVLISLLSCFFILTTVLFCDWLRCLMWRHVPPTCPLASCLQWAALSGLWVWALPPQALQPLAGCTGAFPGQVPSTTCVPPAPPPSRKHLV